MADRQQTRWNALAAQQTAIEVYRALAAEHRREAQRCNRAGMLRDEIRHWEAAAIASQAADREGRPDEGREWQS